jgi:bacterioferritin-associated ferredoxin
MTMIICSCNVITDRDVRKVIDLESPLRAAEVYVCLGCSARCGRCAPTIRRIVADAIRGCTAECVRRLSP